MKELEVTVWKEAYTLTTALIIEDTPGQNLLVKYISLRRGVAVHQDEDSLQEWKVITSSGCPAGTATSSSSVEQLL